MGGSITVESTLGQGSRFHLRIPVGPATAPEAAAQAAAPRRRLAVLVVEDDPINQIVASGLLAQLGHDATIAETGMAALAAHCRFPGSGLRCRSVLS
jgi:CheY-like chemotaxis protein